MTTELTAKKPEPGIYATKHEHVLARLTEINDMPYWSLNLVGEDTDYRLEHFKTWTEEAGYRYFVELQKNDSIDRIYALKSEGHSCSWFVLRGQQWPGYLMVDGKMVEDEGYLGYRWPEAITIMMHGTWNAVRYCNIAEGIGYEPEDFAEELGRDLTNLQKVILATGNHCLRAVDLPTFPSEEN